MIICLTVATGDWYIEAGGDDTKKKKKGGGMLLNKLVCVR